MTDDYGLDLHLLYSGKVRRMYEWPSDSDRPLLLMVATDAISAFDHVLPTPIPDKGRILNQLSLWWFDRLGDIVENHVVSTDVPQAVAGRAVITESLQMLPVECVARGYLTGSGWVEYQQTRTVCGVELPPGLVDGDRLPEPIFTPAVKAPVGEHDENVSFEQIVELHGYQTADELRRVTLALYTRAEQIARERGILLADTKFEFGRRADGTLVLADEVLTPDSSRFWDAEQWRPGEALPSFDKQYVRDWLAHDSGWDRTSDDPPPPLPQEVVSATRGRYIEAYERLTTRPFDDGSSDRVPRMARVIVDVMPKPEILDPQGKATTGALARMGMPELTVRQGRRFEITVDGEITDDRLAQVREAAEKLLANTEVEYFDIRVEQ